MLITCAQGQGRINVLWDLWHIMNMGPFTSPPPPPPNGILKTEYEIQNYPVVFHALKSCMCIIYKKGNIIHQ
jgi:hypothetical protein